jgi:hypothetical protein
VNIKCKLRFSKSQIAGFVVATAASASLAFPIAWESHLMNRCISELKIELMAKQEAAKQVDYFIQAVRICNGG